MPLQFVFRFLFGLLSLVVLAAAAYLLWDWYDAPRIINPDGTIVRIEEPAWKLWTGVALLALSLFGGFPIKFLLAKPDADPLPSVEGRSRTLTSSTGAELHIEEFGTADARGTLLLTHGWGLDHTIWGYAVRDLSKAFHVVVWDLPGLGKSKAGHSEPSLTGFAQDLQAVINSIVDRRIVLVGHSIGGMTIQTLARDHPEVLSGKVAGVVLLNTTYTNPLRTMILPRLMLALRPVMELILRLTIWLEPLAWLSAWQSYLSGSAHLATRLGFGGHVTRSQLERTTLLSVRNRPAMQAKGNLAMFRWDATGALSRLAVPLLIVAGDSDIVTKPEASEQILASAPRAQLLRVPGVNHMGFLEKASTYQQAIAAFAGTALSSTADSRVGTVR